MKIILLKKYSYIFLSLTMLLIYSALIPMQLSDYVLCFGEDGHVKIESTSVGCCSHVQPDNHKHTERDEHTEDDHCGECVDLPIFATINSEIYNVSTYENTLTDTDISPSLPKITKSTLPYNSNLDKLHNLSPMVNPILISIRTVTLLI